MKRPVDEDITHAVFIDVQRSKESRLGKSVRQKDTERGRSIFVKLYEKRKRWRGSWKPKEKIAFIRLSRTKTVT